MADAGAELEALNRAHHEHMLEMVNTAQTLENKRHARLGAAKSQAEAAQLERAPCDREAVARGRAVVLAVQLDARPALGRAAAPVTPGEG